MEEKNVENEKAKNTFGKMLRINRLHKSVVDQNTGIHEIRRSQFMMLFYLAGEKESPSQKELAAKFNVTAAAIAMSIKKLEKSGMVERKTAFCDNRVNLISLTDKGRDYIDKAGKLFSYVDNAMFVGVTDEEFGILDRVFDKLIDNLLKIGAEDVCKHNK